MAWLRQRLPSVPERAEAGRNYDYRYAWIRDQCYAGSAVAAAGEGDLLDKAVRFVSARLHCDGPALKPAYTADGGVVPDQSRLELPGYPGGFDLTGNWVNKQFQLDTFGEALLLFADAARRDHIDTEAITAAQIAADAVAQRWDEPDAGIWEVGNQAWTHSRLICAAGLRAAAATCAPATLAPQWTSLADRIVADTGAARDDQAGGSFAKRSGARAPPRSSGAATTTLSIRELITATVHMGHGSRLVYSKDSTVPGDRTERDRRKKTALAEAEPSRISPVHGSGCCGWPVRRPTSADWSPRMALISA
jgi:GH15 family glucan-1,4-alpha-glucosidase